MINSIKIHLDNDKIILNGSPEECVGSVLRGCVLVHVKETMKVKSITLNLMGKMKIHWNEKNHQVKKEFTVLEHNWCFLSNQKKLHILTPNVYKYHFEFVLPGDLAETMDSSSHGSLIYRLKAIVDRPTFSPNLIDQHPIRILRELNAIPEFDFIAPIQIQNEWLNKLDYKISVPKKTFYRGEPILIDISLTPKSTSDRFHVRHVSCFLKEYTTFIVGHQTSHKQSKIIRFFKDESFPSTGFIWSKSEMITVPYSFDAIQCGTSNTFFRVEHKLKFIFSFINSYGDLSELRASIPIDIVNQKIGNTSDQSNQNELPSYENAWMSAVYSPLPYLENSSPRSPCSLQDENITTPSFDSTQNTQPDYFNFQPSCSLPPYYTLSNPPSYEL